MNAKPHSLQRRLLVLVLGVVSVTWVVTACLVWIDARHELDELLDGHLAQAAAILVVQHAEEMDEQEHGVDAPSLHRYAPKVVFQVFHEGQLTVRSANAPTHAMAGTGRTFKAGFDNMVIAGVEWRVFSAYGPERDVEVFVGEESRSRDSILWAVLRSTLLPMLMALPLLAVSLWWAILRSVAPMRLLGLTLAQRRPDVLEPLPLGGAPAEIAPMVHALNGLFERIARLLESERRFTADASHELRTPIAAIRAQAQVALGETDDAQRRRALNNTLLGCDRAIHLVDQLLTMSRLDAAAGPTMAAVDLSAMVRQVVADLAPKAIAKGQSLELESAVPCAFACNDVLVSVLVHNLIDNALRYCPTSSNILITVRAQGAGVLLRVEDDGPGMAEADIARLGERFFRVTGSEEVGSGLGGSIVRRIADAHHLFITIAHSQALGGLSVTLSSGTPAVE